MGDHKYTQSACIVLDLTARLYCNHFAGSYSPHQTISQDIGDGFIRDTTKLNTDRDLRLKKAREQAMKAAIVGIRQSDYSTYRSCLSEAEETETDDQLPTWVSGLDTLILVSAKLTLPALLAAGVAAIYYSQ
jgi:hypothetical protein